MSDDTRNLIRHAPLGYEARSRHATVRAAVSTPAPPTSPPSDIPRLPADGSPPSRRPPGRGSRHRWRGGGGGWDGGGPSRPRLRKLRLFLIVLGLLVLAVISTVFGMMMAVASDIPLIENQYEYRNAEVHNSYLYDDRWRPIGIFAAPNPEVIDPWGRLSQAVVHAVVAVEDKRFWSSPGVDFKGIARALVSDISGGPTQGASTITEQFVKNALVQQGNRTIFEKLREAALAFHLTQKWTRVRILTEYLNSVYFGNGAYGIESAARVYFGKQLGFDPNAPADGSTSRCGDVTNGLPSCASKLNWYQAALLAGIIADPSAFDPITDKTAATDRRNLVLRDMLEQHYISRRKYIIGINQPVPGSADLQPPTEPAAAPYFTSWLRPQILSAMGWRPNEPLAQQERAEYRAYYGGLKIRTTLDLKLQQAAEQAIASELPTGQGFPGASLVAIDNRTGEVRAMVGGPVLSNSAGEFYEDYQHHPFNLATESERQPGSSFKPFTLAVALEHGFGPSSLLVSAPLSIMVPGSGGKEIFHVHNFGNAYSGVISLQGATDVSDNSAFERLGWYELGPVKGVHEIKTLAQEAGITSPISTNPSMILGGLTIGVNPLEMAHAYETFATGGRRVYNLRLGSPDEGPTGIAEIQYAHTDIKDVPHYHRVMPLAVAQEVHSMLTGVVSAGTGTAAAISGVVVAGKTGTTTNEADAWFVGWTPQLTTAVWVGFPDKLVPMLTLFNGGPVEGGTYPALIWHLFMTQALQILASEQPATKNTGPTGPTAVTPTPAPGPSSAPATTPTTSSAPKSTGTGANNTAAGGTGGGTAGTGPGNAPATGTGTGTATGAGTGTGVGGGGSAGSGGAGIGSGH